MLRRFLRHEPPESAISSEPGSSRSRRSLKKFLSFVDDKEPPKKKRSLSLRGSSMPTTPMSNLPGLDVERPVRPARNGSVIDIEN
uniref:Uncharacterized protein n=1 Tax=Arundo donax TaxID=35708 RepID=A0A0A9D8S2_ARUDO